MNKFTVSNLALLMSNKVSQKEIEKIVDRLEIHPADNLYALTTEAVSVASVQLLIRRYASLADYIEDMNGYIADAVNQRAQLICLPAYAGLLPVSILPQHDKALAAIQPLEDTGEPDPEVLFKALSQFSDFAFEAYYHTMAALALRHRVYIMAGSTLYFDEEDLCHRAFLFNHKGELVGYQDKCALTPLEQDMGIEPASEVRVFDTPMGMIALLITTDADHFELGRIAKSLGAHLLLCPSAFPGEYTPVKSALGLNMRVQESKLYGVQSTLAGDTGLGFTVEGGCTVYAPNEMVKQKNGIVSRASGGFGRDVVCTPLNLDRLELIQNPYMQDRNREFMNKYIDRLY